MIILSFSTFIFSAVYAYIYYNYIYETELKHSDEAVLQISQTISSTASIAAYLEDKDLANEVVNGLVSNDIIQSAALTNQQTVLAKSILFTEREAQSFDLPNPFILHESIGFIYVVPNTQFIRQNAREIALSSVQTLLIVIVPMLLLFAILSFFLISKPLGQLSQQLTSIIPGSAHRIEINEDHEFTEIGKIGKNINAMLSNTEMLFEQERSLRLEIEQLEKRFRLMFERSSSPTLLVREQGDVTLVNDAAKDLLAGMGIDCEERFPDNLGQYCKTPDILYTFTENSIQQKQVMQAEFEFTNPLTLSSVWLSIIILNTESDGQWYFQVFLADITSRKTMLNQLSHRAQRDSLTSLYNRYGAELTLVDWIDTHTEFSLLLLDLDEFKPINDIYGHNAGDEVLKHVAQSISYIVSNSDLVCRWGGDEFVVAIKTSDKHTINNIAQQLLEAINTPIRYERDGHQINLHVGVSIGISHFPTHANTLKGLVECADVAMYSIKKTSKNQFTFYST
ncbi:diguanylate cyclase [Pseudoalteromonas luteoviolacea]|uniref:Diguanylate cyclase n=1 Tax=Pseudoalteromonas luteoviolacea TaxID=43657 RepID=A0A0C1QHT8_9GAMM|nr:sensor domain-containing diguanylate cyclase [Pseudoalteromonas luteoviolacea]KID54762.1 diguanylate cyclase [Pseudoalteromonas luteoviolacea]